MYYKTFDRRCFYKMDSISIKDAIAVGGVLSMIKLKIYYVLLIILVSVNRKIDKGVLVNFLQYETYCLPQPPPQAIPTSFLVIFTGYVNYIPRHAS